MSLAKAQLIELDQTFEKEKDGGRKVAVQFNPESLKVTFANQIVQPQGGDQAAGNSGRQFVGAGTTKLALQLWFDVTAMEKDAAETLKELHIHIPSLKTNVDALSGGQRQAIAIARAIRWKANLVILDEPTAALSVPEQNKVLELARRLASQNVAVVYITHNMNDVMAVTDRIAVLYRGRMAGELLTKQTNQKEIVSMIMSGGEAGNSTH